MKLTHRKKVTLPHVCHPGCKHDHEHTHEHAQHPTAEQLFHAPGESPAVYSVSRDIHLPQPISGAVMGDMITRWVENIRAWAVQHHYLVGHIKVFVEAPCNEHLWLATTGKSINTQQSDGWSACTSENFQVRFTAIIFGVADDALQAKASQQLENELKLLQ